MPSREVNQIEILVRRIALIRFSMNEKVEKESGTLMDFNIKQNTNFNVSNESAKFEITFSYVYQESQEKPIEITVLTEFQLVGFGGVQNLDENSSLTIARILRNTILACLALSLTHTRTLLYQCLANSIFMNKIPLQMFNIKAIGDPLYPPQEEYKLDDKLEN